jgi:signal transduction histidine kinase
VVSPDPSRMSGEMAQLLDAHSAEVLARYEDLLESSGSGLVRDPNALAQCLDHARCILADVVASFRSGRVVFDSSSIGLATDIGLRRAERRIPLDESLKAAILLFEVIFTEINDLLRPEMSSRALLALGAQALHHSLAERVRVASAAYSGHLLSRVREVLNEERRHIAHELHDRVGAGISAANRNLELYELYQSHDPARAGAKVATAQGVLRETMDDVRELTAGLRARVPNGSLEKALLSFVESAADKDVSAVVVVNGDERWASDDVLAELFLITREALRNALTHGRPQRVAARIDVTPDEVRALVEDDGAGFDPGRIRLEGTGIESMRERAHLIGGSATVASWPDRGTRVEVLVPARRS